MTIRVLRSARRTIADGIRFYEALGESLGAYFLSSIMADLRSLSIYAGVHRKFDDSYYRMVCKRFPYSIYYKMEGSIVKIYAVLDDRKNPASTKDRLQNIGLSESSC